MKSRSSKPQQGNTFDRLKLTYQYLRGKGGVDGDINDAVISQKVRQTLVSPKLHQETVSTLKSAAELGLTVGRLSEASIRLPQGKFLITGKASWFYDLAEEDLIVASEKSGITMDGDNFPEHWEWHRLVYQQDVKTQAIILAQPASLMALIGRGDIPNPDLLKSGEDALGGVSQCDPDSDAIIKALKDSNVLLISGVGSLLRAKTLKEAVIKLEIVSRWSEITLQANS